MTAIRGQKEGRGGRSGDLRLVAVAKKTTAGAVVEPYVRRLCRRRRDDACGRLHVGSRAIAAGVGVRRRGVGVRRFGVGPELSE